ncbi:uncharacterized protein I303_104693 [Kwoniella dejecticola CBS 10117]|uniref:Uncharacterized protein n=1 Tax=Kwoniella dejecticola CBS 10117 TaxID=1296121 RepID=A0AAJ8KQR6_9TREE
MHFQVILYALLAFRHVTLAIVIGSVHPTRGLDSPTLVEKDTCVCPYDPEQEGFWECQLACNNNSKRMYLSTRDLTNFTERICFCPLDDPFCNCPPIHWPHGEPPKGKREPENTVAVLHAQNWPPDGHEVCHTVNEEVVCIPCIEKRVVCPVNKRALVPPDRCLRALGGKFICPPCPPTCCPRDIARALEESGGDVWCRESVLFIGLSRS